MKVSKERELAVYTLMDITANAAYNNLALRGVLNQNNALSAVQKAFVTELVNGALRNLIYLDYVLNRFSKTPTVKMKPFILNDLRVAAYQILYMDRTPAPAACDEAVNLAKAKGFAGLSGFVNGVLRNIARADKAELSALPGEPEEKRLGIRCSYPQWLIDYWRQSMNEQQIQEMCAANSRPPKVTICVNTLKTDRDSLRERLRAAGMRAENGQLLNALYISKTSDLSRSAEFAEGLFHVMDESAMLAVEALNPKPGQTVFDLCGAPGGKSFLAAYLMQNTGKIITRDLHEHKIDLIQAMAEKLGITMIEAKMADATVHDPALDGTADCLLLDVPCSGFGLIRKKPDIKYSKTAADIDSLVRLQRAIFAACVPYVKPGGTIVYSTCTVSAKENEENARYFAENFPVELERATQLYPGANADGFFIAKFQKKEADC